MSAPKKLPTRTSQAYKSLTRLQVNGGMASASYWRTLVGWSHSAAAFDNDVIYPLRRHEFVSLIDGCYTVTDAGLEFLGIDADASAQHMVVLTGPRYAPERKPLDLARHMPRMIMREGSQDYRDIPSMIGSERVPYTPLAGGLTGRK